MIQIRRRRLLAGLGAAAIAAPSLVRAQGRTIRLVVPFPAGGSADLSARLVAEHLRAAFGPTIVENKPGAGGNIAAADAARSAPDGSTLFVGTNGTQTINASLYRRLPFDPERDFVPIGLVWEAPHLVVVGPSLKATTLADLAAQIRARPGAVTFASSGLGSATHLAGEMLARAVGAPMTHVPYRGQGPALTDLIAGRIDVMIPIVPDALAQVSAGAIRALALTATQRSGLLPDVPTAPEAGMPDLVASSWVGLFAPRGTPEPMVGRLEAELAGLTVEPDFVKRLRAIGIEARPLAGAAFAEKIAAERRAWASLVAGLGIAIE